MDAVSALLRAAIRIAGASAAIVAYDDDHRPVAFTGCSQGAAALALRDGSGAYIDCRTPVTPMTLVLLEPARTTAGDAALMALANELGHAVLESQPSSTATWPRSRRASKRWPIRWPSSTRRCRVKKSRASRASTAPSSGSSAMRRAISPGLTEDLLYMESTSMENVMHMRDRLAAGDPVRGILELQTRESMPLWIEMTSRVAYDSTEHPTYYVSTLRDISARKEFEAAVAAEKQRLSVTLKAIGDAVITALPDGRIDFINAAAQRLLNVAFAEAYGMPLRSIVDLRDEQDAPCEIHLDPAGDVRGEGLLYGPERNTQIAFVSSPMCGVLNPRVPFGYVIVLRDVTAQVRLTRRLAYEASHDSLTRLPNRRRFEEMIEGALVSARHSTASCTRSRSSTSIVSNRSTTRSATRPAIGCCATSRTACRSTCAATISSRASAATSSRCCCTSARPRRPNAWSRRFANRWNRCRWSSTARRSSSARASGSRRSITGPSARPR